MDADSVPTIRLAELLASLSLGIDLGFGQPMEHVLRQCRISLRLGEMIGLDEHSRASLYYAALLVNVGCHSDAYEQARWCGDDIVLRETKYQNEPRSLAEVATMLRLIGSGNPPLHRIRVAFDFMVSGHKEVDGMLEQHARFARVLGEELHLAEQTLDALSASYERWDGRGWPGRLGGDAIPIASRITQLAEFAEVAHRSGGIEAARVIARRRSGKQFDPALVEVMCTDAEKVFHGIDDNSSWDAVIDAEPTLATQLSADEFDASLAAVARFVDLKSPFTLGHAEATAELVRRGAERMGLAASECRQLYRCALVSGFGRLGVSNSIWDKRAPLSAGEWERVRLQPQLTERMLRLSEALAPLGRVAGQYRERLDGSGYPRGLSGNAIPMSARLLAAADAYQAMREPRPHRAARTAEEAARELRNEIKAGLDGDAVQAVLEAPGHRAARRVQGTAGLTAREVEVLRLLARGHGNKDIARQLVITPKTASNHIEHIYTKIGVSNRAAAAFFAMQNGLLPEEGFTP